MIKEILPKWIKDFFYGKEKVRLKLPFAFIRFTREARIRNVKDDQNKFIEIHTRDKFNNYVVKREKYHPMKVRQLNERNIPVYDRTKEDSNFGVIGKSHPGSIEYKL